MFGMNLKREIKMVNDTTEKAFQNSLDREINELLIDKNFLKLKNIQNKSNLFEILAVSHLELWHSAFIIF